VTFSAGVALLMPSTISWMRSMNALLGARFDVVGRCMEQVPGGGGGRQEPGSVFRGTHDRS
jgi:hypothetical protein